MSGYTDPITIVLKFHRGLNKMTQDKITESETDWLKDNDHNSWYQAAWWLDLNHLANEAFHYALWHPTALSVRGHPSISLLPLSSSTFYLCICISPPHLCTISKDRTYSRRLLGPMVWRLPRSWLTNSRWLPTSLSARTSTTSDGLRTHWDRPVWCYGTLRHHVDSHIWEAWY
jgi:hypothetical protein